MAERPMRPPGGKVSRMWQGPSTLEHGLDLILRVMRAALMRTLGALVLVGCTQAFVNGAGAAPRPSLALAAQGGVGALQGVEAFVNGAAPDLVAKIVSERTALGGEIKAKNRQTGGSAVLESAALRTVDSAGLVMDCVVRRRVGGFGRKFEECEERATCDWPALGAPAGPEGGGSVDGKTAQVRLMEVACALGLHGAAARLLDTRFPGGLGDAAALPKNLWLNNIPASKFVRRHMSDSVIAAVLEALCAPDAPPTLSVSVKPPELDVEMDTYRVGTLLELVRSLAFSIVRETGRRVKICVQAPMGEGIFAGMPLSLNGVRKLLEVMDWGEDGDVLRADGYIRFGAISADDVDAKDDVFILIAPQSIVGSSVVPLLEDMVNAADGRPVITINANLDDIQSAQGVMSYRGRDDRLKFAESWEEIYHFSTCVPIGRTFFPILGAVVRPSLRAPYALYQRGEVAKDPTAKFKNSSERAAAARAGDLDEVYRPVGCFSDMPDAKQIKQAFKEAATEDFKRQQAAAAAAAARGT